MGLYNILKIKKNCPFCGTKVEWQTKNIVIDDIYYIENVLASYKINKRMDAEAYTFCDKCKKSTDLVIKKGKIRVVINNKDLS